MRARHSFWTGYTGVLRQPSFDLGNIMRVLCLRHPFGLASPKVNAGIQSIFWSSWVSGPLISFSKSQKHSHWEILILWFWLFWLEHKSFKINIQNHGTRLLSYEKAKSSENLKRTMLEEIEALQKNETWDLVSPPLEKNIFGSRWAYKRKEKSDGLFIYEYKWLVAKGFSQ